VPSECRRSVRRNVSRLRACKRGGGGSVGKVRCAVRRRSNMEQTSNGKCENKREGERREERGRISRVILVCRDVVATRYGKHRGARTCCVNPAAEVYSHDDSHGAASAREICRRSFVVLRAGGRFMIERAR